MKKKTPGSGRAKGTPNKLTRERREMVNQFFDQNLSTFQKAYKNLKPAQQCKIFVEMMKYTVPALSSVSLNTDQKDVSINESLRLLAEEVQEQIDENVK